MMMMPAVQMAGTGLGQVALWQGPRRRSIRLITACGRGWCRWGCCDEQQNGTIRTEEQEKMAGLADGRRPRTCMYACIMKADEGRVVYVYGRRLQGPRAYRRVQRDLPVLRGALGVGGVGQSEGGQETEVGAGEARAAK
ncbi:hypothetical protein BV20DRAFT_966910 [Pilatotrama ljubarskyi]|nr:hypothetical protein BV20DRAFT_966910 [Pilatotrama ljubarskyi]